MRLQFQPPVKRRRPQAGRAGARSWLPALSARRPPCYGWRR